MLTSRFIVGDGVLAKHTEERGADVPVYRRGRRPRRPEPNKVRHRLFPLTLTISQRVRKKYWHYVIANFCRGRRPRRPESCGRCREQHPCEAHRGGEELMSRILWKCLFEMISQNAQITKILASIRKSREAKQTENIINSRRSISLKYVKFTSENQDRACKIAMDYKK